MGLLSDQERSEFKRSISSKKLPQLQELFNQLSADRNDDCLSDNTRAKAAEKAAIVQWEIKVRNSGGFSG